MKKIWKGIIYALPFGIIALLPQKVFAVSSDIGGYIKPLDFGTYSFGDNVANILKLLLFIAGAAAFAYLVYGGIIYITAAGSEDKIKVGKTSIINAVIGIIIIILTYLIISWVRLALKGQLV